MPKIPVKKRATTPVDYDHLDREEVEDLTRRLLEAVSERPKLEYDDDDNVFNEDDLANWWEELDSVAGKLRTALALRDAGAAARKLTEMGRGK